MNRIELETPMSMMEGANAVYLLREENTVALVDTGVPAPSVWETLTEKLARYDVSPGDIDSIFLTHGHPDHAGLAGMIQRENDATVYLHEADRLYVQQVDDLLKSFVGNFERFDAWGVPAETQTRMVDAMESVLESMRTYFRPPTAIEPITDGQSIPVGDLTLDVTHTPGHTQGSVVFSFDGETGREAFTGDTLLPGYTANIGTDPRIENPIAQYLTSLHGLGNDLTRAWPGHRHPITEPAKRVNTVIEHHEKRTADILDVLRRTEELTVWELTMELFEDLQGVHTLLAASEIEAHLVYLERNGSIERIDDAYRIGETRNVNTDGIFAQYRV